jgi:Flp pilus assembly protein TadB
LEVRHFACPKRLQNVLSKDSTEDEISLENSIIVIIIIIIIVVVVVVVVVVIIIIIIIIIIMISWFAPTKSSTGYALDRRLSRPQAGG